MAFKPFFSEEFDESFGKLTRKNKALKKRLIKKIDQILAHPHAGDPKSHNLKGARGSHVDPYVIVYMIKGDLIIFIYVNHHDKVYAKAATVLSKIESQYF